MASQIISFRLSEPEVQALEAEKLVGESLNQVAQRLMRQMLNGTSKSVDSSVDARLNYLEAKMAMILGEVPGELSAARAAESQAEQKAIDTWEVLNRLKKRYPKLTIEQVTAIAQELALPR